MHDDSYENYPKHLRNLAKFLDMAKAEDKAFEVFVKNNNFKKAANMNDLAEKILIDHLERNLHF